MLRVLVSPADITITYIFHEIDGSSSIRLNIQLRNSFEHVTHLAQLVEQIHEQPNVVHLSMTSGKVLAYLKPGIDHINKLYIYIYIYI